MTVILLPLAILLIFGFIESHYHKRALLSIPLRIHVNGTRGKSETTRLIAGALREAGFRVIAKTTGTTPRIILENGQESPIIRRKPVTILEQLKIVRLAYKRGAQVLVTECMGVNPEVQWTLEHRIIMATIGVITNVREDHLDEMGPELEDVARALSLTIPHRGHLITAESKHLPLFQAIAAKHDTTVSGVKPSLVSDQELAPFSQQVFRENVACALETCKFLGVEREMALQGMYKVAPDPGAFKIWRLRTDGRFFYFINALAANDVASTQAAWNVWEKQKNVSVQAPCFTVGIFNNRNDRGFRIKEMAQFVKEQSDLEHILIVGELQRLVKRQFRAQHLADVTLCGALSVDKLFAQLKRLTTHEHVAIFAFGNIKGDGWLLIDYFERNGEEL